MDVLAAPVLAAAAGVTPKAHGDDRACVLAPAGGGAGVVVCDGVGGLDGSAAVAERCTELVRRHVGEHGAAGVLTAAAAAAPELIGPGATTLIALAADAAGRAYWTLVGNGSVFELEAIALVGESARLGWAELAIPQVDFAGGRPSLRSTLPARAPEVAGGMLLARPGRHRLLLACSDGIASQEDWREGTSSTGTRLRELPAPLALLFAALAQAWTGLAAAPEDLAEVLGCALARMLADGLLEDDATAGAVLLR